MMEMVVTTGAIRHAKLQSDCHHRKSNTELFTGRMPFLLPNNCVKARVCCIFVCIITCVSPSLNDIFEMTMA